MATRTPQSRWLTPVLVVLVLLSTVGVLGLWFSRHQREADQAKELDAVVQQGPRVTVAPVEMVGGEKTVTLPGDVRPFSQATLYAKVSGYLKEIRVDKGDRVKKNQIIGILESPETDQQVAAAEADLLDKRRVAARAAVLAPRGVVSQQELDTAGANLEIAKANLARARALKDYEVVRAPFDGTVTGRYADVGALLPAATGSTQSALPLIDLAETDRLRITVYVGQDVASFLREGDGATLTFDERPDLEIQASVTRLSKALDPRSRAMLCEIWLDNREYRLYQGSFLHVALHLKTPPLPTVPSEALVTRGGGLFAAVVRGQRVSLVPIEPGLDDGKTLQVRQGLSGGELVALNLPSEISDGAQVQPVRQEVRGPAAGGSGK